MFWIKGHQDNNDRRLEDLPYDAQLNIMCDGLAKAYWNDTRFREDNFESRKISHLGSHMSCNSSYFSRVDKGLLYDLTYGINKSLDYCEKRIPLNYGSYEDINWDAIKKAVGGLRLGQKHWLAKHIAGMSSVGVSMMRRGEWHHDRCPVCLKEEETPDHVIQCKDKRARRKWKEGVTIFLEGLDQMNTEPHIYKIIENRLLSWPTTNFHKFKYDPMPSSTRQAMEAQDLLGWRAFIYGRISILWQDAQKEWLVHDSTKWKIPYTSWSVRVVKGLFHLIRGMWDHRNQILHDKEHTWNKRRRKEWNREIREFYRLFQTETWNNKDKRFFAKNKKVILSYEDAQKQQWLTSVQQAYNRRPTEQTQSLCRDTTILSWLIHGNETEMEEQQNEGDNAKKPTPKENNEITR